MVKNVDEDRIGLPVHFFKFDAYQLHLLENFGIEKEIVGIER